MNLFGQESLNSYKSLFSLQDATGLDGYTDNELAIVTDGGGNTTGFNIGKKAAGVSFYLNYFRNDSAATPSANSANLAYNSSNKFYYVDPSATVNLLATESYVTSAIAAAVVGVYDLQGGYDASTNLFPTAADTNPVVAAIKKGFIWNITVAGTLGGVAVNIGDTLLALVDSPGQTASNWLVTEYNFDILPGSRGGTGVANTGKTMTIGGNFAMSGAFTFTGTVTGNTAVTFPTSGTLATIADLSGYVPYSGATGGLDMGVYSVTTRNITLPSTTSNAIGVFFKGGSPFIHDYAHATATGKNIFIGINSGNFTMSPGGGAASLASNNVIIGQDSFYSNTTGFLNTGLGNSVLAANTTGSRNTVVGYAVMSTSTTGVNNSVLGYGALYANTTGSHNTVAGYEAMHTFIAPDFFSNTGDNNTAVGAFAMYLAHTGYGNTAIGYGALYTSKETYLSVAIGYNALNSCDNGFNNVSVGVASGPNVSSGGNNTFLGYGTGAGITTGSNNTIIGANVSGLGGGTAYHVILADGAGNIRFKDDSATTFLPRLTGNGFVKTSGGNGALSIDTNTYLTTASAASTYLPLAGFAYLTTTGNGLALTTSTLSSGALVSLVSTSTNATGNTQTVFIVNTSGANGNINQTTAGATFENTHTGTGSTNVAAKFNATGGTSNIAIFQTGGDVYLHSGAWVYSATTDSIIHQATRAANGVDYTLSNNSALGYSSVYILNSLGAGFAFQTFGSGYTPGGNLDLPSTNLIQSNITTNMWLGSAHPFSIWTGGAGSEVKKFAFTSTGIELYGASGNATIVAGASGTPTLTLPITSGTFALTSQNVFAFDAAGATYSGKIGIGAASSTDAQVRVKVATDFNFWTRLNSGILDLASANDAGNAFAAMTISGSSIGINTITGSPTTIGGITIFSSTARLKNYTVATLPAGVQGDTAYVTDALAPTFLATIVGGGAIVTPVFFNGSSWIGY